MKTHPLYDLIHAESPQTLDDYKFAFLKIIHKICLLGLWRGRFFEYATFYGGTALSMVYNLDRFSEDLDFSLLKQTEAFSLSSFLKYVEKELNSWGIDATVTMIEKEPGNIESAIIKKNTKKAFISMSIPKEITNSLHHNEVSKVKFDIFPALGFRSEFKYILDPIPFNIRVMNISDNFAGKIHAMLARRWGNRTKGRDWYDFIWFVKRNTKLNIKYLENRLKNSGYLQQENKLDLPYLQKLLLERINNLDIKQAKEDVLPFVKDHRQLENWSEELFIYLVDSLEVRRQL